MFDFFLKFDPKGGLIPAQENPFRQVTAYDLLKYSADIYSTPAYHLVTLFRPDNNRQHVYESPAYLIVIFGYIFRKNPDPSGAGKYMNAAGLHDWISAGREINETTFSGSYTLLIIHKVQHKVTIVTDLLNVKLVYADQREDVLVVSGSLDAIVADRHLERLPAKVNTLQIINQLLLDLIPGEETLIQGIRILPAGSTILSGSTGQMTVRRSILPNELTMPEIRYGHREGLEMINQALKYQLNTVQQYPGNKAMALTGGYDSRTLIALLGADILKYSYYSYGHGNSWDISIPGKIAGKLGLPYETYFFDEQFNEQYDTYVNLALTLSGGTALFTQSDIPYIYRNHLQDKTAIISGLFGSELLKYPSGRGLVVNDALLRILFSANPEAEAEAVFENSDPVSRLSKDLNLHKEEFIHALVTSESMNRFRSYEGSLRFFHYLISWGARKYFAKEIAMERPFLENLTPFWEPDFMSRLLNTQYAWVHMPWKDKKSKITNLKLHSLYAKLIYRNNPVLAKFISTHATRPLFLLNELMLPLLMADYYRYRKQIKKQTFSYSHDIIDRFSRQNAITYMPPEGPEMLFSRKQNLKLISIRRWCLNNHIPVPY